MSVKHIRVIGDPHFKISNTLETDRMVGDIIKDGEKNPPDMYVVLGDILDRHENLHTNPMVRSMFFLKELSKIALTYVLIGNHDLKNNRQFLSTEHGFYACKYWENLVIVDTVMMYTFPDMDYTCLFCPYVPPGRFIEALETIGEWKNADIIFAHQEFKGAKMMPIFSTEGDEWSKELPFVISGHIHDYQTLYDGNIVYTGTPIQHGYGDAEKKGIYNVTVKENCNKPINITRIILPSVLIKKIYSITCSDINTFVPKEGYLLKIKISGTSGEIRAAMKNTNISTWKNMGHKVSFLETSKDATEKIDDIYSKGEILPYSVVLKNRIQTNQLLLEAFDRVYGI
jgi:DNA repair exonuclease SbcCD nuclease subunit